MFTQDKRGILYHRISGSSSTIFLSNYRNKRTGNTTSIWTLIGRLQTISFNNKEHKRYSTLLTADTKIKHRFTEYVS